MDTRQEQSPSETKGHRPISQLLECPAINQGERKKIFAALLQQKQGQIRNALIFGLFVGICSFAALRNRTGQTSFSIISSVVLGIFAVGLSHRYLNKQAAHKNLQKCPIAGGMKLNDNGFFGPETLTWKTGMDPSFLIASIGAGLLQMLHPDVVRLIEKNGKFYEDPVARGERTGLHARSIIYGDKRTAIAASEALKQIHKSIKSVDLNGEEYSAAKPELLLWVHNSLTWMILRTFRIYGPTFTPEQENQYVKEQHISAKLVGIENEKLPNDMKELDGYMDEIMKKRIGINKDLFLLRLTKDSEHFRDFLFKKPFPRSLKDALQDLYINGGMRVMTREQQNRFCFQPSRLKDFAVESIAKLVIKTLRYELPADEMISIARADLVERSFGHHFLKG